MYKYFEKHPYKKLKKHYKFSPYPSELISGAEMPPILPPADERPRPIPLTGVGYNSDVWT